MSMTIKDVCLTFSDGDWIESKDQSDCGIRLIQTGNVGNGEFLDKPERAKYVSEETYSRLNCTEIFPGDILVSRLPDPIGRACIIPESSERMITAVDCTICRPDEDRILKEYLCYYMQSSAYYSRLMNSVTGTTRKRISRSNLGSVEVPVPDKSTQKSVVEKFDRLNTIIRARKEELAKLDNLIKARFVEMFGLLEQPAQDFPRDILKNLCNKITDGKHGGCTQEDGTERYFVGAREIYDDAVHYETAPQINVEEFEKDYRRCNVEKGDFLIVNTGATIGKSAIAIDERTECTLLQKSVALLKTKRAILHPVFLKYCYVVNDKMYKVKSASAQPNLLLSKINSTEIYVPSMALQEEFVAFVDQVDKSKVVINESLDETQLLFDSMMQRYFG